MTIRVIDTDSAEQILVAHRDRGLILSALNLFMLGFLKNHPSLPKQALFWCDGLMGVMFMKLKGLPIKQMRGVQMLKVILNAHKGSSVNVLGTLNQKGLVELARVDIDVTSNYSLDALDLEKFDASSIVLSSSIAIITLPSPKQELLAVKLAALPANSLVHFYCVGGALNMLSNPELDCPNILQKLGMEFIFRLGTDTRRRILRLLNSAQLALRNIPFLIRQPVEVIEK